MSAEQKHVEPASLAVMDLVRELRFFRSANPTIVVNEVKFLYGNGEGGPTLMTLHIISHVKSATTTLPRIVYQASGMPNIWRVEGDKAMEVVGAVLSKALGVERNMFKFQPRNDYMEAVFHYR